jgi:hypothetical protein
MNPPLTAGFGMRFLEPRATCALCGRECDADGAPVCQLDPTVEVSAEGLQTLAAVTPGEQLVVCKDCASK